MEEEAEKLKEMHKQVEDSLMSPTGGTTGTSKIFLIINCVSFSDCSI